MNPKNECNPMHHGESLKLTNVIKYQYFSFSRSKLDYP